jgi:hypothetical protein
MESLTANVYILYQPARPTLDGAGYSSIFRGRRAYAQVNACADEECLLSTCNCAVYLVRNKTAVSSVFGGGADAAAAVAAGACWLDVAAFFARSAWRRRGSAYWRHSLTARSLPSYGRHRFIHLYQPLRLSPPVGGRTLVARAVVYCRGLYVVSRTLAERR